MAVNKSSGNSHRGRLDIISDILEASRRKVRKTQLMYRCNLSFKQVEHYLGFLLERKLLCHVDGDPCTFKITSKGERFLQAYKSLLRLMG
ncbi:MAG: winged helix-turn-helix domain-containing protein [Candidatus Bathyarchaeia archaeon]|nr:hypothetical protein [Candidatus Bathyarchaeota archaeon]